MQANLGKDGSRSGAVLGEQKVTDIFVQLLSALEHIHSRNIIHRDLKPANILFYGAGRRIVKIADFGVSKFGTFAETTVGTPYYLPPELCEGQPYTNKADLWSLGCILHEMCCLERPFVAPSLPSLIMKIMRAEPEASIPRAYSRDIAELCDHLLQKEATDRPSASELLSKRPLQRALQQWEDARDTLCRAARREAQIEAERLAREENGMASEERVVDSLPPDHSFRKEAARQLSNHLRVWKIGPGAPKPRLLETLLQYDIERLCCGGFAGESNGIDESDDEEDDYGDTGSMYDDGSGIITGFTIGLLRKGMIGWGANERQVGAHSGTKQIRESRARPELPRVRERLSTFHAAETLPCAWMTAETFGSGATSPTLMRIGSI